MQMTANLANEALSFALRPKSKSARGASPRKSKGTLSRGLNP